MQQLRRKHRIKYVEDISIMDNENSEPLSHTFVVIEDDRKRGWGGDEHEQNLCKSGDHNPLHQGVDHNPMHQGGDHNSLHQGREQEDHQVGWGGADQGHLHRSRDCNPSHQVVDHNPMHLSGDHNPMHQGGNHNSTHQGEDYKELHQGGDQDDHQIGWVELTIKDICIGAEIVTLLIRE